MKCNGSLVMAAVMAVLVVVALSGCAPLEPVAGIVVPGDVPGPGPVPMTAKGKVLIQE